MIEKSLITQKNYQSRLSIIQQNIKNNSALLVSKNTEIHYLSGFEFLLSDEREAFLLITKNQVFLLYTSFSPVSSFPFLHYLTGTLPHQLKEHIKTLVDSHKITTLYFDPASLFVEELYQLQELQTSEKLTISPTTSSTIQQTILLKDDQEIEAIRIASKMTAQVCAQTFSKLHSGITEIEVAKIIKDRFESLGAIQLAFPTIVAFGAHSAKPHHQPSSAKLKDNSVVLIDLGCRYQGYCSDMTRTTWFGTTPSKKFIQTEKIVKEAYTKAVDQVKKINLQTIEIRAKDVDNAARVYITNSGYGEKFIHTTGHSLGLAIHEPLSLSWKNTTVLQPRMVITVEPGIYFEGEFGYRYENTILITKDSVDELTQP